MAYSDFATYHISFNQSQLDWMNTAVNSQTFNYTFTPSGDLTKVQNSAFASDFATMALSFFNQKAIQRTIREIYKQPQDYLADYNLFINNQKSLLNKKYNNYITSSSNIESQKQLMQINKSNSNLLVQKLQSLQDIVYKI